MLDGIAGHRDALVGQAKAAREGGVTHRGPLVQRVGGGMKPGRQVIEVKDLVAPLAGVWVVFHANDCRTHPGPSQSPPPQSPLRALSGYCRKISNILKTQAVTGL